MKNCDVDIGLCTLVGSDAPLTCLRDWIGLVREQGAEKFRSSAFRLTDFRWRFESEIISISQGKYDTPIVARNIFT